MRRSADSDEENSRRGLRRGNSESAAFILLQLHRRKVLYRATSLRKKLIA
jgi:hypothetical protein